MHKLVGLGLLSAASATWNPSLVNITSAWPGNDDRPAGGIVNFDSPAGAISGGNGTCDVTISTAGVSFVSFFNAHVLSIQAVGVWTITALGEWQDQGSFDFIMFADDMPQDGDVVVECQDDTALNQGQVVLSSFPNDFPVETARGSFAKVGNGGWPSEVVLTFDSGMAPQNFTIDDPRLTVTENTDSFVISGLDAVNYQDVWFSLGFADDGTGTPLSVASYDITVTENP